MTKMMTLYRLEENIVKFDKFREALYIVCLTLVSTFPNVGIQLNVNSSTIKPPISTSDMCIDMNFFEDDHNIVGVELPKTGLISVILVVLNLFVIILIFFLFKLKKYVKASNAHKAEQKRIDQATAANNVLK
jgi:uncharacterized membrane protein